MDASLWTDGGGGVFYNGESGGTATGYFIQEHGVLNGDSILRLEAYPDPTNIVNCFEYNSTIAAEVSNWGGAGTHSILSFGYNSISTVCMRFDTYPGIAPMSILFGGGEIDFAEFNIIPTKNGPVTFFYLTILPGGSQHQIGITAPGGVDFSQWGVLQCKITSTQITLFYSSDGVTYTDVSGGAYTFTSPELAAITSNEHLCLQIQTGDVMANPGPDSSVTSATPVKLLVDWVAVDIA